MPGVSNQESSHAILLDNGFFLSPDLNKLTVEITQFTADSTKIYQPWLERKAK
jgi:hypothetical protein